MIGKFSTSYEQTENRFRSERDYGARIGTGIISLNSISAVKYIYMKKNLYVEKVAFHLFASKQ